MLESGSNFFACEIVSSLSENNVYQSYLARAEDGTSVRLLVSVALFVDGDKRVSDLVQQWKDYTFAGVSVPQRAGFCEDRFVCTYPAFEGLALEQSSLGHQLPTRDAIDVVQRVASLLVEPHQLGLAHGNVSPATIVFKGTDLFLDGFFLNQVFKLDYQSGLNPAYTSPEQVRGEMPVAASDIYNLGCVLYSLLSGQQPFNGTDSFTVAMQHLQGAFPELPEGHCCRQLLVKMTQSASDERLTAVQLLDEIQILLDSEEINQVHSFAEDTIENPLEDDFVDESSDQVSMDESLDFTARIEARLKEYSSVMAETIEPNDNADNEIEVTNALEQLPDEKKSQIWRYLLILLIGIFLGSGLYFLVIPRSVESLAVSAVAVDEISDRLDQALVDWQEKNVDEALSLLQELVNQYPDDPRPINNLAAIYAAQGDYEHARESLERALETDANYATIYNNLASIYAEMARDSYGRALLLDQTRDPLQLISLSSQGGVEVDASVQQEADSLPVAESAETAILVAESGNRKAQTDDLVVADVVTEAVQEKAGIVVGETPVVEVEEAPVAEVVESAPAETVALPDEALTTIEPDIAEPVAEAVISTLDEDAVKFMQRWAKAWSEQDIAAYLACYDEEFSPPGGRTRVAWESQRQQRISKPDSINVTLIDHQVENQEDGSVRFEAIQVYRSDVYSDKTHKVFNLHQVDGTWLILRERSLGSAQ